MKKASKNNEKKYIKIKIFYKNMIGIQLHELKCIKINLKKTKYSLRN